MGDFDSTYLQPFTQKNDPNVSSMYGKLLNFAANCRISTLTPNADF
jgi:hypothetical protein